MVVAGIDVGGRNVHAVVMKDGDVVARGATPAGIDKAGSVERLFDDVLARAGLRRDQVARTIATGSAGKTVRFASLFVPDAAAVSRGVNRLVPSARTIIDVGAEEGRAIKVSAEGSVQDFAVNDRCAAGTGTFIEAMARALEIPVEEMGGLSLVSARSITMNAQCAVFGESEVVSLIHEKIPRHDIARAVHDAVAGRIGSLVRIVGLEKDVVLVGGLALSRGFVESLEREIGMDVIVPDEPDYAGALGAALEAMTGKEC